MRKVVRSGKRRGVIRLRICRTLGSVGVKDWSLTPEGEADQDWREGGEPRPLCRVPDGRGRHSPANVPGDFAVHRGTAAAAATSASVRRSIFGTPEQVTGGLRPDTKEEWSDRNQEHHSGAGLQATGHEPDRDFRVAQKIATARPKFGGIGLASATVLAAAAQHSSGLVHDCFQAPSGEPETVIARCTPVINARPGRAIYRRALNRRGLAYSRLNRKNEVSHIFVQELAPLAHPLGHCCPGRFGMLGREVFDFGNAVAPPLVI